tara:strand:- start:747 stop:998 length:252 start_codon:yes stop_codon:yes gene_type:complete
MESIYEFIFDVDDDIINMINDLFRIVTLQIVTQGLFCLNNKEISFFNQHFLQTVLFLSISIIFYWMIIRKILKINKENKDLKN